MADIPLEPGHPAKVHLDGLEWQFDPGPDGKREGPHAAVRGRIELAKQTVQQRPGVGPRFGLDQGSDDSPAVVRERPVVVFGPPPSAPRNPHQISTAGLR